MTRAAIPTSPDLTRAAGGSLVEAINRASIFPLTIEQYQRLIALGIVPEDAAVELLRGVLVRKDRSSFGEDPMSHGARHRLVVSLLTAMAAKINAPTQFMQIQLPVACPPHGAPEPDVSIVRGNPRDYSTKAPGPGDVSCVIEVSDSSLDRDRNDKHSIYAAAGFPQYIIVNLVNDTLEVSSDPDAGAEQYRTNRTLERGEMLAIRLPEGTFDVLIAEILP